MAIIYDPQKMLRKLVPVNQIKKLAKPNLTIKKAALTFIDRADFIDRKEVNDTALKVLKNYRERVKEGGELKADLVDDPRLLIQRVENAVLQQVKDGIQIKYKGERAVWLPSSASEPDPEHQLNYGKEFVIGEGINGEEPGDRYGCQCGMEILVNETELDLSAE